MASVHLSFDPERLRDAFDRDVVVGRSNSAAREDDVVSLAQRLHFVRDVVQIIADQVDATKANAQRAKQLGELIDIFFADFSAEELVTNDQRSGG